MIVEFYPDGKFHCDGEPKEIVEFMMEIQEGQQKAQAEMMQINLTELFNQVKKTKNNKKEEKKNGTTQ